MENSYRTPEENILDDLGYERVQAALKIRLSNLLIDQLVIWLSWYLVLGRLMVSYFADLGWVTDDDTPLVVNCLTVVVDILYFTVLEAVTGGKTIGKMLTRTRAVNQDGTRIGFKKALLRSLCRMVPFEVFSALGSRCYPWHDRWTKTLVIDEEILHLQD